MSSERPNDMFNVLFKSTNKNNPIPMTKKYHLEIRQLIKTKETNITASSINVKPLFLETISFLHNLPNVNILPNSYDNTITPTELEENKTENYIPQMIHQPTGPITSPVQGNSSYINAKFQWKIPHYTQSKRVFLNG